MTSSITPFYLSKFYMDCITSGGDALVIYTATVKWLRLKLSYVSLLETAPNSPTRTRTSLRAYSAPAWRDGSLCFDFTPLKISARWQTPDVPLEHSLLKTGAGEVIWTCLAPCAHATITHRGQHTAGTGYAEHLLLTIAPWQLPIKELHWGRFHSASNSLVWIKWLGEHPFDLTLHNGVALDAPSEISSACIKVCPFTLEMTSHHELRTGPISSTVLWPLHKILSAFPSSILNLYETKWLSEGTLHRNAATHGDASDCGYALHEHVIFPGNKI